MKKSLVLAMAMALGVTASAYAANPFSDVPAGHWAYDSVAKLAAAGVVDGYADGAFDGDKLMTRYEMAQIVAKAMAKGADCDKLAAEFADELDTLGVRVAKLEKGADAVKISGQIRASYVDYSDKAGSTGRLRTRLVVKGAINDDWSYTGRLESNQYTDGIYDELNKDDDVVLNWAYVSGKIGGMKADIGRQTIKMHSGLIIDEYLDAAKLQYGKDYKLTLVAGKGASGLNTANSEDRVYIADVTTKVGVADARVGYYKFEGHKDKTFEAWNKEIYNVGATLPVAKGLKLSADWFNGDVEGQKGDENGYVIGLAFGGAKASAVGSWGVYANWYDMPLATYVEPSFESYADVPFAGDGVEGYEIGVNYTLAKNIVAGVKYYDLEGREAVDGKTATAETIWTEVTFTF